jgi:C4-dicarboxylate transporter DctM subunit
LFEFERAWVGRVPGGLGVATVLACAIFAAISGSSVATVATVGLVAFPALTSRGYREEFGGALIAAGGTLGILIPPSIALILYGLLTEQSIGALFIAGAIPGLVLAAMMAVYTMVFARVDTDTKGVPMIEKLQATRRAIWIVILPVFVLLSIYMGFATPTEVAAIAVVYVLLVGLLTRRLNLAKLRTATVHALRTTVMIFMIVAFGRTLTEFFTLTGLPQLAVETVQTLGLAPFTVVALMIAIYIVLGTFLEAASMMLISVPILFPVSQSIGMDPLAFGIFVVLAIEAAQITPPIGINLYTLAAIGKVHLGKMALQVLPYVGMMIVMMMTMFLLPELATWLPGTMK